MRIFKSILKYTTLAIISVYICSVIISGILTSRMRGISYIMIENGNPVGFECNFVTDTVEVKNGYCENNGNNEATVNLKNPFKTKLIATLTLFPFWKTDYTEDGSFEWRVIRRYDATNTYIFGSKKIPVFLKPILDSIY